MVKRKEPQHHPAAEIFPMMDEAQLAQLASDIKEQGLLEPISILDDQILDGRNRFRACALAGVKPEFIKVDLDGASATEFVLSKNLHRRHLTTAQRAALALELLPDLQKEAELRQHYLGKSHEAEGLPPDVVQVPGTAAAKAAELVGLGHSSVEKTIVIQKKDPSVIERMRSGEIKTIDAARREIGMLPDTNSPISPDLPRIYYGKGDRWREASQPILRYLQGWEKRGYEFRHINHTEARRRLKVLDEIEKHMSAVRADLEQRSIRATTRMEGR